MNYKLQNFGPVNQIDLELDDLTVLIGPQATGKTKILELLKMLLDSEKITHTLSNYGYTWSNFSLFQELYFGEGTKQLIQNKTKIQLDKESFSTRNLENRFSYIKQSKTSIINSEPSVFYIPAQRAITVETGWSKNFQSYETTYPYIMKEFSENLRRFLDGYYNEIASDYDSYIVFSKDILKDEESTIRSFLNQKIREIISTHIYRGSDLIFEKSSSQKKILKLDMGLHPEALFASFILILSLLSRGYKVILTTHSIYILEIVWALQEIQNKKKFESISELLKLSSLPKNIEAMLESSIKKKIFRTYYLKPDSSGSISIPISLDNFDSEKEDIRGWGGLMQFSDDVTELVAKLHSEDNNGKK